MKKRKTIYHLIVDKSGSMYDCIENTISGFNEQVKKIKANELEFKEEEITIGLTTFNDHVNHHFFQVNPGKVNPLNSENYVPNGSTALLDAIGKTVQQIESEMMYVNQIIPTTVVIVILTDGYENASKSFNLENVRKMISRLEETGKWTFSFIGATLDAVDVAKELSIKTHNSFSFDKSEMSNKVWDKLNTSMSSYFDKKSKGLNTDKLFED